RLPLLRTATARPVSSTLSLHDALPICARSTFFFSFHSAFYNLLEREVADKARAALAHGHWLGLHYESEFYGGVHAGRIEQEAARSEEHTSELQSPYDLVCRLLLEKKNK